MLGCFSRSEVLRAMPTVWELARRSEEHMKGMVLAGTLFEELGFNYIGPVDGHDVKALVGTLRNFERTCELSLRGNLGAGPLRELRTVLVKMRRLASIANCTTVLDAVGPSLDPSEPSGSEGPVRPTIDLLFDVVHRGKLAVEDPAHDEAEDAEHEGDEEADEAAGGGRDAEQEADEQAGRGGAHGRGPPGGGARRPGACAPG